MFTLEQLQPYLDAKLLSEQVHPENSDVRIYNYTNHCQFAQAWDEVTLRCRGLILNVARGEILANPFPKFFNWGQRPADIPAEEPLITEKLDGSLGILYWLNDKPRIATRGSFISDQAQWATQWLDKYLDCHRLDRAITYLTEIVYPQNRIVVSYAFQGCVLLAARETATGRDLAPFIPCNSVFPLVVKQIPSAALETLAAMDAMDSEGFVCHWPEVGLRLKLKYPTYVRLHKILTGLSVKGIWEHLAVGQGTETLLDNVPDEFYAWVQQVTRDLQENYQAIETGCQRLVAEVAGYPTRKDKALEILAKTPYTGVCFAMLDGKDYAPVIWKLLQPKGSQTFKIDIDA